VTRDQHQLYSITSNICKIIFDILINPFFVICQRIFSAAGPATQPDRLSGPVYPKRRFALAALEKIAIRHLPSLAEGVSGENTAKIMFCQIKINNLN